MRSGRAGALALLLAASTVSVSSCRRTEAAGQPTPARPAFLVPMSYEQAFSTLASLAESRGMPVVVEDAHFGNIRTDWVRFAPGEVDLAALADCGLAEDAAPVAVRVRYAFEVRKRANRATVQVLAQYQAELHSGFDGSDRGYSDCPSTGEWERRVEQSLTQRGTIG